jgi:hypothetical protein
MPPAPDLSSPDREAAGGDRLARRRRARRGTIISSRPVPGHRLRIVAIVCIDHPINWGTKRAVGKLRCLVGSGRVELSKQWRKKAADCLRLSREANTLESQNHWVSMADLWFRMARHVEDREVIDSVDPAIIDLRSNGKAEST